MSAVRLQIAPTRRKHQGVNARFALGCAVWLSLPAVALADDPGKGQPPKAQKREILRWTDAQGGVHYTDNPASIPSNRRSTIERTPMEEPPESSGSSTVMGGGPSIDRDQDTGETDGAWRMKFVAAYRQIHELEQRLREQQAVLDDPAGHGVPQMAFTRGIYGPNPEYAKLQEAQAKTRADLEQAKAALAQLDREASRAGVPRRFRQDPALESQRGDQDTEGEPR